LTADDTERALLAERILAEQEERRRLAELLHDGPVQQLSAVAQLLDAGLGDLEGGDSKAATEAVGRALMLAREAARDLRALCDDLEPRVLHALGFTEAAAALARRISARQDIEIALDLAAADDLGENAATALYQILREAIEQAVRRGTPSRIEISLRATETRGVELVIADDGPPERRAAVLEALAERAATLNARFSSEVRYPRGSTIRIEVPPSSAHR
jgi:signal transduction histidine kinase